MLYGLLVALHVLVSVILILVVLLQTGKGADLAGAFGGGGSQTAFGSRGAATVLSKMTTAAAVIFMVTSFTLAMLSIRGSSSVLDSADVPASPPSPAAPAPAAPAPVPGGDAPAGEEPAAAGDTADPAGEAATESAPGEAVAPSGEGSTSMPPSPDQEPDQPE